jgi:hypothetical protein
MDQSSFINEIRKLRPSATFLTLSGYRNGHGEVADYNVVFNISYQNALKRSLEYLFSFETSTKLELQAKEELIDSYTRSLNNIQLKSIEARQDAYMHFIDPETDDYIKGIKIHIETGTLHLFALINYKRVITPGVYPVKNQRPLTVAKAKLSRLVPCGRFRQFKILPGQVDSIQVQNISLLPPG